MTNDKKHRDLCRLAATLQKLTSSAQQVARGNYDAANNIFQITISESEMPELRELAETLGLMSVKVEGREYQLEQILADLKKKKAELEQSAALRTENGFLFCSIVFLLCIYAIALSSLLFAGWNHEGTEKAMTLGLTAVIFTFVGIFIKYNHHPWATWGLTWKGGIRSLWESLLFSIPVALAGITLKWALVRIPASPLFGHPIFEPLYPPLMVAFYALVVIAQEIINRGFLQTSIERILTGKYRALMAISTASLIFAVAHLHYAIPTMLATLLGGFFFGWLFHRHGTLVGVSVVHFLLGLLFIDILRLLGQ